MFSSPVRLVKFSHTVLRYPVQALVVISGCVTDVLGYSMVIPRPIVVISRFHHSLSHSDRFICILAKA